MSKEQIVGVLNKDKVYTSYYARACKILPDRRLVAISIGIPEGFKGEILRELNPSVTLLSKYKNGELSDKEYEQIYYTETLSKLNATEVYNKLKGKCALCFCGSNKFCHRILLIKWLIHNLGDEIYGGEI